MGPKKIDAYMDSLSLYSYFAYLHLQEHGHELKALGVEVNIIPIFLPGVMQLSGNEAPWKFPPRGKYTKFDSKRAQKWHGKDFSVPKFFPINSVNPQRVLTHVKDCCPDRYEKLFGFFFKALWEGLGAEQLDTSKPDNIMKVLTHQGLFSKSEAEGILAKANSAEVKAKLTATTEYVVKGLGGFGAPWFWVDNGNGNPEPFFGQDRWHYMYAFLDLPRQDLKLEVPGGAKL